jgi:hypothetical protein
VVLNVDSVVEPHRKGMYRFSSNEFWKAQNRSTIWFQRKQNKETSITSKHCGGRKAKYWRQYKYKYRSSSTGTGTLLCSSRYVGTCFLSNPFFSSLHCKV